MASLPNSLWQPPFGTVVVYDNATSQWIELAATTPTASIPGAGTVAVGPFGASGSANQYQGTINLGSPHALALNSTSDFQTGQGIFIAGAGVAGANLVTTVSGVSGGGQSIGLTDAAATAVTNHLVQHDDTGALQTGIQSVFDAGGGTLWFPNYGFYRCNKGFNDINSILKIPYNPWKTSTGNKAGPAPPTIALRAYNSPVVAVFAPQPVLGPVIQTDLVGVNSTTSMLSTAAYSAGQTIDDGNQITVVVEGLTFRTYDNPNICGPDFGMCWNVILRDVQVDTGMSAEDNTIFGGTLPGGAQPTHGTFGLRLPRINVCTVVNTDNLSVGNYGIGVIGSELWKTTSTYIIRCGVGVQGHETAANYPITGNLLIVQCTIPMYFPVHVALDVHVEFEYNSTGWWATTPSKYIFDETDTVTGWIKYLNIFATPPGGSQPIATTGLSNASVISLDTFGSLIANLQTPGTPNLDVNNLTVRGNMTINDGSALEPISFGPNDSGERVGTGFRDVVIPNSGGMPSLLTNLVSYWKMDEVVATDTRLDVLGTNNLVPFAANPVVSGILSNGVHATTGQFLAASDNASQVFAGSMSIAGWLNVTTLAGGNGIHTLLAKVSTAGDINFVVRWDNFSGQWQFFVTNDGSTVVLASVTATPTLNTWYHVAAVFETGVNQIRLRINDGAVGVGSQAFTGPIFHSAVNMASLLQFTGSAAYGDCAVDELGLWGKALSLAEITHLYNGGVGITYPF